MLMMEENKQKAQKPPPSKLRNWVPKLISFLVFTSTMFGSTLLVLSTKTIPDGYVGYYQGTDGYINPSKYFELPWSSKELVLLRVDGDRFLDINGLTVDEGYIDQISIIYKINDIDKYVCYVKYRGGEDGFQNFLRIAIRNAFDINGTQVTGYGIYITDVEFTRPEKKYRVVSTIKPATEARNVTTNRVAN